MGHETMAMNGKAPETGDCYPLEWKQLLGQHNWAGKECVLTEPDNNLQLHNLSLWSFRDAGAHAFYMVLKDQSFWMDKQGDMLCYLSIIHTVMNETIQMYALNNKTWLTSFSEGSLPQLVS